MKIILPKNRTKTSNNIQKIGNLYMNNLTQDDQTVLIAIGKLGPTTRGKILDESTKNLTDVRDKKFMR
jgi:hypothetical protein